MNTRCARRADRISWLSQRPTPRALPCYHRCVGLHA